MLLGSVRREGPLSMLEEEIECHECGYAGPPDPQDEDVCPECGAVVDED